MSELVALRMPKWGLSMQEGTVVHWWKEVGSSVTEGEELVDIETPKITNVVESPATGVLRRKVAHVGDTLPIGALIGVVAPSRISDAEIDSYVSEFQAKFVPGSDAGDDLGTLELTAVEVGGRTIRVGRSGSGKDVPAVFLHGFSGDLNTWVLNTAAIASEREVVVIDLPGHGGSSKDVGDGSLATLAQTVAAVLSNLNIDRAHIVGHSMGAAVAAKLAIDRPELVLSLVLICPSSLPGNLMSEDFLNRIVEAQRARDLRPALEMLFFNPALATKEMADEMAKFKRLDGVGESLVRLRDRLVGDEDRSQLAADLPKIHRATVIASHNDRIVGVPDEAALPKGFRLHWIEGAGHMPHIESAAEVNAILTETMRL